MSYKKCFPVLVLSFLLVISIFGFFPKEANANWEIQSSLGIHKWQSIASSSDGNKLAAIVNEAAYIYTSTDSGATWTERTSSGLHYWQSIASSSNGNKLAAVTYSGYIYTSIDSGETWTEQTNSGARLWHSIASSSDGTKLVAEDGEGSGDGSGGYIYTSADSGETWTEQINAGLRNWRSIASSSDGNKLVVGDGEGSGDGSGGYIYTSIDSGETWTEQINAGLRYWYSIASSSNGNKLAAVNYGPGYIYTSIDSGETWTEQINAGSRYWQSIASSSNGNKLAAVTYSGYIYISVDSGVTWNQQTAAGSRIWTSIASSSDGDKIIAGVYQGYLYIYTPSPSVVSTSSASAILFNSATLNGNISNTGGDIVSTRGFQYGLTTSYGLTTTESGSFGIGDFSSNINSLSPNTTYHYRSYANNSGGTSYGDDVTFTTLPIILLPSLTTLHSIISDSSATLNGNISNTGGENISTRGFEYGTTISYGSTTSESGPFGIGDFYTIISSLTPGTTYHFRSYATNSAGTEYGEDLTFTIPAPKSSSHRSSGSSPAVIAQFQAEQKALTVSTPVITTSLPITRTLKYKITGDDVKALQVYLNTHGYPVSTKGPGSTGKETNYFGPATRKAVILFQTANKLVADGIVGAMTRGVMK